MRVLEASDKQQRGEDQQVLRPLLGSEEEEVCDQQIL